MSIQTPLARVRYLGSAKEGSNHWWWQRLTALLLVPLSLWFVASISLVVAYIRHGILTVETATMSAAACLPAFIGLVIGQMIHPRINQRMFRRILLVFMLVSGLNLLRRAIF